MCNIGGPKAQYALELKEIKNRKSLIERGDEIYERKSKGLGRLCFIFSPRDEGGAVQL